MQGTYVHIIFAVPEFYILECKLVCTHVTVLLLIALPDHDLINYYILFVSYYSQYNVFIIQNATTLLEPYKVVAKLLQHRNESHSLF